MITPGIKKSCCTLPAFTGSLLALMKSTTQIQIFKDLSQNGETIVTRGAGVVAGGAGEKKRKKMRQITQHLQAPLSF